MKKESPAIKVLKSMQLIMRPNAPWIRKRLILNSLTHHLGAIITTLMKHLSLKDKLPEKSITVQMNQKCPFITAQVNRKVLEAPCPSLVHL